MVKWIERIEFMESEKDLGKEGDRIIVGYKYFAPLELENKILHHAPPV